MGYEAQPSLGSAAAACAAEHGLYRALRDPRGASEDERPLERASHALSSERSIQPRGTCMSHWKSQHSLLSWSNDRGAKHDLRVFHRPFRGFNVWRLVAEK